MTIKSIITKMLFLTTAVISLHALPGVKAFLPDTPSDYVYYQDHTFTRDVYVGFMYYDEETYGARLYAPASGNQSEINIEIYFTVDTEADYMKLTGDKTVGTLDTEDGIIMTNYLRDLIYDFNSRRQKITLDSNNKITVRSDYPQFGGDVDFVYSPIVPLFNIEKILTADGKELFSLVYIGNENFSSDFEFKNFSEKNITGDHPEINYTFEADTSLEREMHQYGRHSFTLDSQWNEISPSYYVLDEVAYFASDEIVVPEELTGEQALCYFVRRIISSGSTKYNLSETEIPSGTDSLELKLTYFNDFPVVAVTKFFLDKDSISGFMLYVLEYFYSKAQPYYDAIIESIK